MTTTSWSERRASVRIPFEARVRLWSLSGLAEGTTRDLSEGGVFVATPQPPEPGTPVVLRIVVGLDPELDVIEHGRVAWRRLASPTAESGCGVVFEPVDDMHRVLRARMHEALRGAGPAGTGGTP